MPQEYGKIPAKRAGRPQADGANAERPSLVKIPGRRAFTNAMF
jgi:hypothetical protein